LVTARLILPKYGGRKSSKREDEDASANAKASFAKNGIRESIKKPGFDTGHGNL
jgi:hypothetical protein